MLKITSILDIFLHYIVPIMPSII